ncbi:type II secretion system secretin GspD [Noviherbaspirillum sp. 1P10PC]|uniref:type II secretion system secretin GspD n=1 Tax=Noviherbaspirillum sp. 1P10PC TaxID=3132292 RepID=UPI0039A15127
MKKLFPLAKCLPTKATWRRAGAATLVMSLLAGMAPARAQDPSRNEAVLNFVGADIESVVKAVGHYTGTNFLIDPRVKGTISLISEKPVTKAQAMQLLSSALRLQGYTVVASGPFTKVVPEADAKLQAGPIQTTPGRGGDGGAVRGDQIATQVFKLNYESAVNMVPVLRPLISPNNTINANPGTNSLVITDYADNLRRLGRIIASLDMPAAADLDVLPIRHAVATDIATMVNRLLDGGSAGGQPGGQGVAGGSDRTSLLADSRTNSVIIRAPSEARARLARSLVDKLDQPTAMPGNVHVIYLKNAEATKLALTLRAVVASDPSASGLQTGNTGGASTPSNPALTNTSGAGLGQTGGGLGQGGLGQGGMGFGQSGQGQGQGSGPLPTGGPGGFIQADPATNSLIITASEAVYRNLRSVVDQLDARRAQVYIESLIVEVSAKRAAEFGIQWAGLSGNGDSAYRVGTITGFSSGGNNLITQAAARLAGTTTGTSQQLQAPGNGLNLGVFRQVAGQLTLGLIARALETEGNANILSMPNLITLDNEEARIIVGQNVPFVTGQYTTAASGGAAGVNPFQTVERKDIGLSLVVKPQVSEGGTVKMAIYQETSAIDETKNNVSGLITTKRAIQTNVLVDNGEIIVLGGLIDDRNSNGTEKVPGLGDIPVVGNLFKYQNTSREKTNLMVFLRPTLIRSADQNLNVASDRYEYIRGQQLQTKQPDSPVLPNVGKPIVPVMENGRLQNGDLLNLPPGANGIMPRNPLQPGLPPEPQPMPVQPALPPQPAAPQPGLPQFTQ